MLKRDCQHFSRKLKWDPSDFRREKFAGGKCLLRPRIHPRFATTHNSPTVRCTSQLPILTPCRMALHFNSVSARATTPSNSPFLGLWGASYSAPHTLSFLYFDEYKQFFHLYVTLPCLLYCSNKTPYNCRNCVLEAWIF